MTANEYNLVTVFSPDPIFTLPPKLPDASGKEADTRNAPIRYFGDFIDPMTTPWIQKHVTMN